MARTKKPALERILEATRACLMHTDPVQLSMRQIAKTAGVSKALLLYHFDTKEALLQAVLDELLGALGARIEALTLTLLRKERDALKGLLQALWYEIGQSPTDMSATLLRFAAYATQDPAFAQLFSRFRTRLMRLVSAAIKKDVRDAERDVLAELIVASFFGLAVNRAFAESTAVNERAFALLLARLG